MLKVSTQYNSGMVFEAGSGRASVVMDASPKFGGQNQGMTPKELVLAGLCGCTGMDVVTILNKMKVSFSSFIIEAEADIGTEEPAVFTEIRLKYLFTGNPDRQKVQKAINLSQEKYCGVSAMLKKNCPVNYSIYIK